jgi:hypothetical protein
VIVLGQREVPRRFDGGVEPAAARGFEALFRLERQTVLLFAVVENGRAVLSTPRRAGGLMAGPEDVEQLLIGDDVRIEIDLDRLAVVAQAVVGGVFPDAAGIAYARADDTLETPELGVGSPESAQAEGGGLDVLRSIAVERWAWLRCHTGNGEHARIPFASRQGGHQGQQPQ